jgi:uncharacterized protein
MHPPSIQLEESQEVPVHRILLSYPLSVRGFLTMFNTHKYKTALCDVVSPKFGNRTMIIFGTEDQFTSRAKYRVWAKELEAPLLGVMDNDSTLPLILRIHEIEGADHFWHESQTVQLCTLVESWLIDLLS